jgi:hypothetical protein
MSAKKVRRRLEAHLQLQPTPPPPSGGVLRKSVVVKKQPPSPVAATPVSSAAASPSRGVPTPPSSFKLNERAPVVKKETRLQGGSSRFRPGSRPDLVRLPNLSDTPSKDERHSLVIQKLRQCCTIFDFTDSVLDVKGKEIKRSALNELHQYFQKPGVFLPILGI